MKRALNMDYKLYHIAEINGTLIFTYLRKYLRGVHTNTDIIFTMLNVD